MASKHPGSSLVTLSAMALALQSTYQNLTHEASRETLASLRVVLYHLDESIRLLTKLSDGVENIKTEQ